MKSYSRKLRLCSYGAVLLLAACAAPQPQPWQGPANAAAWEARQPRLAALDYWRVEGRIAIAAGEEGGSGSLDWLQRGRYVDFQVSGPLGIGGFRVHGDDGWLTLQTDDGAVLRSANLEAELAWRLGYSIPIENLRYWVRGLPAPGEVDAMQLDANGRLRTLSQAGWRIQYTAYKATQGYQLPSRLIVEGEGVRLKLAIGEWQLLVERAVAGSGGS